MGKPRVRKNPGLLYDRLVVMPGPTKFPAYYQLVGEVIREMKADFPDVWRDGDGFEVPVRRPEIEEWFTKWFGDL